MNGIQNIITHLEEQQTAIANAIAALRTVSGTTVNGETTKKKIGRPKGSGKKAAVDEGRERQREAMRAYWAAKKASRKEFVPKKAATKKTAKKGGLTAAGRKTLSDNMKRRWAEKKLGKGR